MASHHVPPGLVLLTDFSADGLAQRRSDTAERLETLFAGRSWNDLPCCYVAVDDPVVAVLRRADSDPPLALNHVREPWRHVIPIRSRTHLEIVLGHDANTPAAALFAGVREAARQFVDFRGRARPVAEIIDLRLHDPTQAHGWRSSRGDTCAWIVERTLVARRTLLVGRPGSGKSMLLRRLLHELGAGELREHGPALRFDARRMRGQPDPWQALAGPLARPGGDEIAACVDAPALRGSVWLLVDGLDELDAGARSDLLEWLQKWPGPLVVTSRQLAHNPAGFATFEVEDLDIGQIDALLRQEGREDLISPPEQRWTAEPRIETAPWKLLRRDLCTTPLGVGLLALPSTRPTDPRTELLRRAIHYLLDVAEQGGRISERVRRWCERKGVLRLGALAWRMLRGGHASITGADLGALERAGLSGDEADLLHQLLEAGGFVQRVGPDGWEFTHKSFAEFCAAAHVALDPSESLPLALLARITDPGVQEVVLHLSALRTDVSGVLEQLLAHPEHPLTAASLATRVLLERPPGSVSVALLVSVLRRRLRLATWLASAVLPGRAHLRADVNTALRRHAVALRPERAALYAACHDEVQAWLVGEDVAESPHPARPAERPRWAEFLFRHLEPALSPAQVLRLHDGVERLARRERGAWADELRPRLDGVGAYAQRARLAWLRGAPLHHLLERIADLDHQRAGDDELLLAAVRHGSREQRREALLRHQLSALSFSYRVPGDSPAQVSIHGRLRGLSSAHWLGLWDWAWSAGLLGAAYAPSPAVQQLYASFMRDPSGPARWRALIARAQLEPKHDETLRLWRAALDDSFLPVRVEAWRRLIDADVEVPPEHLRRALASLEPAERLLAWEWLTATGVHVPPDLWRTILRDPPAPSSTRDTKPARPNHDAAVEHHAEHARQVLLRRAGEALASEAEILLHVAALDRPGHEAAAREILAHVSDDRLRPVLDRVLATGPAVQRRWAAEALTRMAWWREPIVAAALTAAAQDADAEVARIAREQLERQRQYEARIRTPPPPPPRVRSAAPDLENLAMTFAPDDASDAELVETITIAELERHTRFDELWDTLGGKALRWQSFRDMEGFASEEGPEHIGELAGQAAAENVGLKHAALAAIRRLYRPEDHRRRVIDSLGHPLGGYWALLLLADEPRSPDLLRACSRGELALVRVARLAAGGDLASEVAARISDALRAGELAPPMPPARPYERPRPSRWPGLLFALGGLERLLELLHGEAPAWVITAVLSFIEEHRAHALTSATAAERTRTAAWARQVDEADVPRWTLALHLLSVVGDVNDARHWCQRLRDAPLPGPVAVAALELIGRLGDAGCLPTLRTVAETTDCEPVLVAALNAAGERGGRAEADWMFALLERPPPATQEMQAQADAWAASDARERERREAAFAAGKQYAWDADDRPNFPRPMTWDLDRWRWPCYRTVVRFGDRAQALAISRSLVDERQAVGLLQRYGRLPEHALLIFGALRHAPQDEVIPWQITGGGDEVVTDDSAERVSGTVVDFARRVGAEEVRIAFLHAAFWDPRDADAATELLDTLGGPQPRDTPALMNHLERDPAHPLALGLLARAGAGEAEIVACWRRMAVPWWSDADTPALGGAPRSRAQGLLELLEEQFREDPGALRPFVRGVFGEVVAADLPGPGRSLTEVCFELVQSLERRGCLDDLADALIARDPSQSAEMRLLDHSVEHP